MPPEDPIKPFIADSSSRGADYQFWLNGLEGMYLQTSDRTIEIGEENRAFILEVDDETTTYNAHFHDYLGGSVAFDVDVSDVGCGC